MLFRHKIGPATQVSPSYARARLKRAKSTASAKKPKSIRLKIPEISSGRAYDTEESYTEHIPFNFNGMQVYLNPRTGQWLNSERVGIPSSLEQKIDLLLYEAIRRTNFTLPSCTSEESARYLCNRMRNPKKYT